MSLVDSYRLNSRLAKLEKLRTVGRGNSPSKAYTIWKHLVDNGPKTISDLNSELPKDITNHISFFAKNDLLNISGNTVSANLDYKWGDVGVIPRAAEQELNNAIKSAQTNIKNADNIEEVPDSSPRGRQSKARVSIKADIWSLKPEEVKAAIDNGVNVNIRDDKDRTPLMVAALSKRSSAIDIVKLLLDNGADPNIFCDKYPVIIWAFLRKSTDAVNVMVNHRNFIPNKRTYRSMSTGSMAEKCVDLLSALIPKADVQTLESDNSTVSSFNPVDQFLLIARHYRNVALFNVILDKFIGCVNDTTQFGFSLRNFVENEMYFFHSTKILEAIVSTNKWVRHRLFYPSNGNYSEVPKTTLSKLFNTLKSKFDTILKNAEVPSNFRADVYSLGTYLGEDASFAAADVSVDSIKQLHKDAVMNMFSEAINNHDLRVIKMIDESKRADLWSAYTLDLLFKLDNSYKKVILTAIKILDRSAKAISTTVHHSMHTYGNLLYSSKNSYIIEWLFENNEQFMMNLFDGKALSDESAKVYAAHSGARRNSITHDIKAARSNKINKALDDLGEILNRDSSVRDISGWEDRYGDLFSSDPWNDPRVRGIVYDMQYDDSALANQLRREVKRPEPSKYDF